MNQRMSTQEFEDVYHRYKQLLFRIAFSYVKKREDAEDLVQEAYYKRLYKASEFADREHEKRWLLRGQGKPGHADQRGREGVQRVCVLRGGRDGQRNCRGSEEEHEL